VSASHLTSVVFKQQFRKVAPNEPVFEKEAQPVLLLEKFE